MTHNLALKGTHKVHSPTLVKGDRLHSVLRAHEHINWKNSTDHLDISCTPMHSRFQFPGEDAAEIFHGASET